MMLILPQEMRPSRKLPQLFGWPLGITDAREGRGRTAIAVTVAEDMAQVVVTDLDLVAAMDSATAKVDAASELPATTIPPTTMDATTPAAVDAAAPPAVEAAAPTAGEAAAPALAPIAIAVVPGAMWTQLRTLLLHSMAQFNELQAEQGGTIGDAHVVRYTSVTTGSRPNDSRHQYPIHDTSAPAILTDTQCETSEEIYYPLQLQAVQYRAAQPSWTDLADTNIHNQLFAQQSREGTVALQYGSRDTFIMKDDLCYRGKPPSGEMSKAVRDTRCARAAAECMDPIWGLSAPY